MSHISPRSGSCKSFCLALRAAALSILIFTPARAEKSAGCTTERIVSHEAFTPVERMCSSAIFRRKNRLSIASR